MFTKNVGSADKVLRIVVGLILVALFFVFPKSTWVCVASIVGLILIATAFINFCPLYGLLGIKTNK